MTFTAERLGLPVNTVKSYCMRRREELEALARKERCKNCDAALVQRKKCKRRSFCCGRCRAAWWSAHRDLLRHKAVRTAVCRRCGYEFPVIGSARRAYCSRQCYYSRSVQLAQKQEVLP